MRVQVLALTIPLFLAQIAPPTGNTAPTPAATASASDPTSLWRTAQRLDQAGDPEAAAAAYREFLARWPNHRLARSARSRLEYIERGTGEGVGPFARFEEVRRDYRKLGRERAIAEVERILAEHPDFALADEVLLWLGDRYVEAGDPDRAWERYGRLIERFPDSDLAFYAHAGRGALAKARGDFRQAQLEYEAAARTGGPDAAAIAANEIDIVKAHARRRIIYRIVLPLLIVVLLAFAATAKWRALDWSRLRSLRIELIVVAPVVAVLWLLSTVETRWTILTLTLGCTLVLALVTAWVESTRPTPAKRLAGTLGAVVAIAATTYVTLYYFDHLVALGL